MTSLPSERLFSMGAFEGLRVIRIRRQQVPASVPLDELIAMVRRTEGDATGLDFDAARVLDSVVGTEVAPEVAHEFYRACIACVVRIQPQLWSRSLVRGREIFVGQLSRDEQQCFRSAALLDPSPPDEVVEWWEILSAETRASLNRDTMLRARRAERLSLEVERKRLARLAITREPKWVGIDNNTAGYDVLSYDRGEREPVNRLIEVKSTVISPLRFIVTRHEWEAALRYSEAYWFHLWNLSDDPPTLYVRSVEEVARHVPSDQGDGRWHQAEIPVGRG